jgi:hypothetical protein
MDADRNAILTTKIEPRKGTNALERDEKVEKDEP